MPILRCKILKDDLKEQNSEKARINCISLIDGYHHCMQIW